MRARKEIEQEYSKTINLHEYYSLIESIFDPKKTKDENFSNLYHAGIKQMQAEAIYAAYYSEPLKLKLIVTSLAKEIKILENQRQKFIELDELTAQMRDQKINQEQKYKNKNRIQESIYKYSIESNRVDSNNKSKGKLHLILNGLHLLKAWIFGH